MLDQKEISKVKVEGAADTRPPAGLSGQING